MPATAGRSTKYYGPLLGLDRDASNCSIGAGRLVRSQIHGERAASSNGRDFGVPGVLWEPREGLGFPLGTFGIKAFIVASCFLAFRFVCVSCVS